MPNYLPRKQRP